MHRILAPLLLLLTLVPPAFAEESPDGLWSDAPSGMRGALPDTLKELERYREVTLQRDLLLPVIDRVRGRGTGPAVLSLPLPEGGFERFTLEPSDVMAPELAARYPEIVPFKGVGLDTPDAWARFDWGPLGLHGYAQFGGRTLYVNPRDAAAGRYISFYRADLKRPAPDWMKEKFTDVAPGDGMVSAARAGDQLRATGDQRRVFRLAVAATGEYTAYHGGTVALGQAAIVSAINRVTGIYEREFSVGLQLVAGNDSLVYTNAATDPYTNDNADSLLAQNQTNIDSVIGSASYDIGHVFSTAGGGLAGLSVVCRSYKARGETGFEAPTGDAFWVDYVAHEIGHQFGADHTFNGTLGSCSGGNRNSATAYEPGSGTTIMAYAGICGADDIQPHSDDYMHGASFDEITAYLATQSCGSTAATGNAAPVVNAGSGALTIPRNTPFTLTGSATDANGDPLTYVWEEWDLGPAGAPNTPSGNAPLFRSFDPVTSPSRTFPQWSDILNNTQTKGELLPSYTRPLNFRLTARDNRGGVNSATRTINVTIDAGPFRVTAPDAAGLAIPGGAGYTVTWDVADTDIAPVNCTQVDILLSTDGGAHFSQTLISGVANDGTQAVTIPDFASAGARIMVRCSSNIFFDVSNNDFTIGGAARYPLQVALSGGGSGRVTSSPAGIDCGTDCAESYAANTQVTLTAAAVAGSTFAGWSGGGCSGTGTCVVKMDSAKSVGANFTADAVYYALTVAVSGPGSVSSTPAGINCGADCSESYLAGTQVTLAPLADKGAIFTGWSGGGCSGTANCVVTMSAAKSVSASFVPDTQYYTLSVVLSGNGRVSSSPAGIDCGADCSESYQAGTKVTLTPTAGSGSVFTGWSGGGCTGTAACLVTMDATKSVTATFNLQVNYLLTVSVTGTGSVSSTPAGIACGADCSENYPSGTKVTLTPQAGAGAVFTGWSGACSGTAGCVVTMDAAKSVTAGFGTQIPDIPLDGGFEAGTPNPRWTEYSQQFGTPLCTAARCALLETSHSGTWWAWFGGVNDNETGSLVQTVNLPAGATTLEFYLRINGANGQGYLRVYLDPVGQTAATPLFEVVAADAAQYGTYTKVSLDISGYAGQSRNLRFYSVVTPASERVDFHVDDVKVNYTSGGTTNLLLQVALAGSGSGKVASSPAGIDCGTDCSESYAANTQVTLTAAAAVGSTFAGWSGGGCSGTAACAVKMDSAKSVTATFTANVVYHLLSVAVTGAGSVSSTPAGIACGADCSESYQAGTQVTLTHLADKGMLFTGWNGGGCSGTGPCVVTMDGAKSVTANFAADALFHTLTVSVTGAGSVSSTPAGIACGADCSESYQAGTQVTLTPLAADGAVFIGWSGGCSGTGACVVAMDGAKSVAAGFGDNGIVADGGFEEGTPSPVWDESSTTFSTPLCDADCGDGGFSHSGAWWAWFGGKNGDEVGGLQQIVNLPASATTLEFYLRVAGAAGQGYLRVYLDPVGQTAATPLFEAVAADAVQYGSYTKVLVDISAFAGKSWNLRFHSVVAAGSERVDFHVDDVRVLTNPLTNVCNSDPNPAAITHNFDSGVHDLSWENPIATNGEVIVAGGVRVEIKAPKITLAPGFRAVAASSVHLLAGAVNCGRR